MNRYEFLKSMGFRGAALMAVMTSCVNEEDTYVEAEAINLNTVTVNPQVQQPGPGGKGQQGGTSTVVNNTAVTGTSKLVTTAELNAIKSPLLKLDLSNSANASLKTLGGFITQSNIVVAQVSANSYAAVTVTCTHEPKKQMTLLNKEWYCTAHGARFNMAGKGLNSLGNTPIKVYNVATDGKTVVVY